MRVFGEVYYIWKYVILYFKSRLGALYDVQRNSVLFSYIHCLFIYDVISLLLLNNSIRQTNRLFFNWTEAWNY